MAATAREQLLLELINEARLDPLGNAERYISSYAATATSKDADINNALSFFGVNGAALDAAFKALTPVDPLAWNDKIEAAADAHNAVLTSQNLQTHQAPGEKDLGGRFDDANYNWTFIAENVFSSAQSVLHAHAGFMVDWGKGANGMQVPPGHRQNIMDLNKDMGGNILHVREIGISISDDSGTGKDDFGNKFPMGPLVVTEDFGNSSDINGKIIILGVVYKDTINNDFYSEGEGIKSLHVAVDGGDPKATDTTDSGGYSLMTSSTGAVTVTFTNGGLASAATFSATFVAGHNYKLDLVDPDTNPMIQTSVSGTMGGSATILKGLSALGLALTTGAGTQTIIGNRGNDTLDGGADGDKLDGGLGTGDVVSYAASGAAVTIDLGQQGKALANGRADFTKAGAAQSGGDAAGDLLWGIESVIGTALADFLKGGAGNDTFKGGAGADTFIYAAGLKTDTIADFNQGQDVVDLQAFTDINSLAELKSKATVSGAVDAKIDFGSGNVLIIKGVAAAALTDGDFDFFNVGTPPSDIKINNADSAAIAEDTAVGAVVGTLDAVDAETPAGPFTFKLTDNPGGFFTIGGNQLKLAKSVDFETAASHDIKIQVTDNAGNTYEETIKIDVTDVGGVTIDGTPGNDTINASKTVLGKSLPTQEEDVIDGAAGNDTIDALGGDDKVTGGDGNDILKGGAGIDTADYSGAAADVTVSLATAAAQDTKGAGKDTLSLFENLVGSDSDDVLTGDGGKNTLEGGLGNDILNGGLGSDTLDGDGGTDTASFASLTAGVTIDLVSANTATSKNGAVTDVDTLVSIENFIGGKGNDSIAGDGNGNVIEGGLGNDTLNGNGGTDTVSFASSLAGVSVILGIVGKQNTKGAGIDDIQGFEGVIGSGKDDTLQGSLDGDTIMGGAGNDTIDAKAGADKVDGGDGNDTIIGGYDDDELAGGNGTDVLSYAGAASATEGVTVDLSLTGAQDTKGAGKDKLSGFENVTGSDFGDKLTGDDNANVILGGKGDDRLVGNKGNDKLDGGENDDTALGGDGNDTLIGGLNTAVGDTVSYADAGKAVVVNLSTTKVQATGGAGNDTITGFENLIGSSFDDVLSGDKNVNKIDGGAGNDSIFGDAGADILIGGTSGGFGDTVIYANSKLGVSVDLTKQDGVMAQGGTGDAAGDVLSGFEHIIGSAKADTILGNGGNNIIEGFFGDDTLDGGAEAGVGDIASYQNTKAAVFVSLLQQGTVQNTKGAGKDKLDGFENIWSGAGNDTLTGDGKDNWLAGIGGNDLLEGGDGKDKLDGGSGINTASYAHDTTGVTVELAGGAATGKAGEADGDKLTGIANLTGGSGGDVFGGDDNANVLLGNAGDDHLIGGKGNDTLTGGDDNDTINGGLGDDKLTADGGLPAKNGTADTLIYTGITANLSVSLAITAAQNTLGAGKDTISGFENLIGGTGNDLLFGDSKDNKLEGVDGDDTLSGGLGNDTLIGGANGAPGDTASYASITTAVTADLVAGTGTAKYANPGNGKFDLDALQGIENLTGGSAADILTGDENDNVIEGGLGNDTLNAGALETGEVNGDTASYAGSTAAVTVSLALQNGMQDTKGAGKDTLSGFENLRGGKGGDLLTGDVNKNIIDGGAGNDTIVGGDGIDTLTGGAGNDLFRFNNPGEGGDNILDFNTAGDKISIVKAGFGIDAAVKIGGSGANDFAAHYFVAGLAATEAGHGQFLYDAVTGQLSWDDDGTGGNAAVLIADLPDGTALLATHFELK